MVGVLTVEGAHPQFCCAHGAPPRQQPMPHLPPRGRASRRTPSTIAWAPLVCACPIPMCRRAPATWLHPSACAQPAPTLRLLRALDRAAWKAPLMRCACSHPTCCCAPLTTAWLPPMAYARPRPAGCCASWTAQRAPTLCAWPRSLGPWSSSRTGWRASGEAPSVACAGTACASALGLGGLARTGASLLLNGSVVGHSTHCPGSHAPPPWPPTHCPPFSALPSLSGLPHTALAPMPPLSARPAAPLGRQRNPAPLPLT